MITRARRGMTLEEEREVERLARDSRDAVGCMVAIFAVTVLLAAGIGLAVGLAVGHGVGVHRFQFGGTGLLVGVVFAFWAFRGVRRRRDELLANDLFETEVDLVHVHAFAAARVLADEAFLFDVGEGSLLVVRGPATRAPVRAGRFPNRYFTLVRLSASNRTLRIECHGEPLEARDVAGDPGAWRDALVDGATLSANLLAPSWRP